MTQLAEINPLNTQEIQRESLNLSLPLNPKFEAECTKLKELSQEIFANQTELTPEKISDIVKNAKKDYKEISSHYTKANDLLFSKFDAEFNNHIVLSKELLKKIIQIGHLILKDSYFFTYKEYTFNNNGDYWKLGFKKNEPFIRIIKYFNEVNLIGTGSNGTVHKILDISDASLGALKISRSNSDPNITLKNRQKILLEYHKLIKLNKDHFIGLQPPAKDLILLSPEHTAFLSPLFNKSSLATGIKELYNCGFNQNDALQISIQLIEALEYLHKKDFIHGDIKPSNCFLNIDSENNINLVLGDLGGSNEKSELITSKNPLGTDYTKTFFTLNDLKELCEIKSKLSNQPEEYSEKCFYLNQKRDIFALATTLWFLLSQRLPFKCNIEGTYENYPITNKIFGVKRIIKFVGPEIAEILKNTLKEKPRERPSLQEILYVFKSKLEALRVNSGEFKIPPNILTNEACSPLKTIPLTGTVSLSPQTPPQPAGQRLRRPLKPIALNFK